MTNQEARTLLGLLLAAYPNAAIERPTEDLYTAQIARLDSPQIGQQAIKLIIDNLDHFPTLAEIRREYMTIRRRQPEPTHELDPGERAPIPEWVRHYTGRIGTTLSPEATLVDNLPQQDPGLCDDCHTQTETRFKYGRLTLCHKHALSRAKAATAHGVTPTP